MAMDSKRYRLSVERCRTPPRRRESSPWSHIPDSKRRRLRKSPSPMGNTDKRSRTIGCRLGGRYSAITTFRKQESHRHSKKTSLELYSRRMPSYGRYSESRYTDDSPKSRDFLFKKEKSDKRREDSPSKTRHGCVPHHPDGRREERRRLRMDRHEECYDDEESRRNFLRTPITIPENYKCRSAESRLMIPPPPPLPVAVSQPRRMFFPARLVPRIPHMRLSFPTRAVRAPVLLAPVVIWRPMMPLRPQIQTIGLRN